VLDQATLARHARPAAVLQLSAYADAPRRTGFPTGDHMHPLLGDGSDVASRAEPFDVLVIDEAGQFALGHPIGAADVIAPDLGYFLDQSTRSQVRARIWVLGPQVRPPSRVRSWFSRSLRVSLPSRCRIRATWYSTVLAEMNSRSPICL
jgi:hypothetical protein